MNKHKIWNIVSQILLWAVLIGGTAFFYTQNWIAGIAFTILTIIAVGFYYIPDDENIALKHGRDFLFSSDKVHNEGGVSKKEIGNGYRYPIYTICYLPLLRL